ncbi:hypothetical protein CMV_002391 [Castanea mollissima]|uniref:Uncharacterized protein n=1 Tax=Castanea mollissima TaxID=60419 RepID=A0A8J4RJ47_9ROSI|nr:hypothetical protein CMV_002391 [Castanea mollissima]
MSKTKEHGCLYSDIPNSFSQSNMVAEVVIKRHLLLNSLVLTTLFLSWSLFFTGVSCVRNGEELYRAVTVQHRKVQPFNFAKLEEKPLLLVEHPPPPLPAPGPRPFQEPPPSPGGPPGQNP